MDEIVTARRPRTRGAAALASALGLALAGAAEADVLVVATTPDLKSIAMAVSGGTARVETLIEPSADPEAFAPRPRHAALVRDAALVVRVGLGYDEWLDRLMRQGAGPGPAGSRTVLDLSTDVALFEVQGRSVEGGAGHAHGAANPHYWLDPANAEAISARIAEALTRVAPEAQEAIAAAQARFAADLRERLERWSAELRPFQGAAVVAYHNGWPYFARRFRLNIVDVIEPKEGVAPSPARLAALAGRMRASGVRVILHQPFEPAQASRYLAERAGARIVTIAGSVGGAPGTTDYLALFDHDVSVLAAALAESR